MEVAVKTFFDAIDEHKLFHGEATCLIRANHKNIVRLLGFCANTQEKMMENQGKRILAEVRTRLLCFEYLPGSPDSSIKDGFSGVKWHQRYKYLWGFVKVCVIFTRNRKLFTWI